MRPNLGTVLMVCLSAALAPLSDAVAAPAQYRLLPGLNLPAVNRSLRDQHGTAFSLFSAWKTSADLKRLETLDPNTKTVLRVETGLDGSPVGSDFPLEENTALYAYAGSTAMVDVGAITTCPPLNLAIGLNLASYPCVPSGYTAQELIRSLGIGNILSISRFDGTTGRWITAGMAGTEFVGTDFPILPEEGYVIFASQQVSGWEPPVPVISGLSPPQVFANQPATSIAIVGRNFTPGSIAYLDSTQLQTNYISPTSLTADITTQTTIKTAAVTIRNPDAYHAGGYLSSLPFAFDVQLPGLVLSPQNVSMYQEEVGVTLTLSLPFAAPAEGISVAVVSSNPTVLSVPAGITIPAGATTAVIDLTPHNTGNTTSIAVTVSAAGWAGTEAVVTVKPKPTINLSPLTTLTGLTFTYLLNINLSDMAPVGGMPITLSASPAGIVTLPASVTIPQGATTAQVTVTTTAVGSATISATSPGKGLPGTTNQVTVKPIQTVNYGPVLTPPVGVEVSIPATTPTQNVGYGPTMSLPVGVVVGSAIASVAPATGTIGTTEMKVTVIGPGLSTATAISFEPNTGIAIQPETFAINADGNPEAVIDIDPTAPTTIRRVIVTMPSGVAKPAEPGADQFRVTLPEPQILGMQPIRAMAGQTLSVTLFGKYFTAATSIDFLPANGIAVNNPPAISSDGTMATVTASVAANAPLGNRVVTITTPGWTSTAVASVANTFQVTADAGSTYTSLVSREVGVLVQVPASAATQNVNYGPTGSLPVGVVVASAVSGIVPATGAIGTTGVKVTAAGPGLVTATGITFQPATGITVLPGSFTINPDGNPEVTIDIDPSAPTTMRTVIIALPSGTAMPAWPGANQFRVTLPEPVLTGMQPIRAMVGQTVSLNISGVNLTGASSVAFIPSTGISVNNPPTVSSDGTLATVTFSIAANAPIIDRVVTVTTPGWTTSSTPSPANTFHVTADAGTTYTPLLSQPVGIQVATTPGSTSATLTYGPVNASQVGVMVAPAPPPTTINTNYGPAMSFPVGIAVGGVITGLAPSVLEPGTTTTVTIIGRGLDQVNSVAVIPAAGVTVGTWTPAVDGLSGTVVLLADTGIANGEKTVVVKTATGGIPPAVPHAATLLAGYQPTINSLSPILPTVGTTFTLTLNGIHLQGATKVEIFPADDVMIDNQPVWSSDGTGEHLTVEVTIDAAAAPGERIVIITTPYGVTTMVGSPANTITFFKPMAQKVVPAAEITVAVLPVLSAHPIPVKARGLDHMVPVACLGSNGRPGLQTYATVGDPVRLAAVEPVPTVPGRQGIVRKKPDQWVVGNRAPPEKEDGGRA